MKRKKGKIEGKNKKNTLNIKKKLLKKWWGGYGREEKKFPLGLLVAFQ